jgi:hypothetical protein
MEVFAANYPPKVLALLDRIALHMMTGEVATCGHDFGGLPVVLGAQPNTLRCTPCADSAERAATSTNAQPKTAGQRRRPSSGTRQGPVGGHLGRPSGCVQCPGEEPAGCLWVPRILSRHATARALLR